MSRLPLPLFRSLGWLLLALAAFDAGAQSSRSRRDRNRATEAAESAALSAAAGGAATFAPVPAEHPLAGIWNDPEFTRRLIGSYGFLSAVEPRMTPEEQALYRDKIVPLLREDPAKAIPELESALRPGATAVFDFTLATIQFQSEDFTNAVSHYEQAIAKFPDYRRAQQNLGLALVRMGRYEAAIAPLTRSIALGGADGRLLGLLGYAYLTLERFVSAQGAYLQAMIFEPDNLDFKLGLVKSYIGLGNLEAAAAMLDELLQTHPDREVLWSLQANVFIQREQPAQAIVNLEILRKLGRVSGSQLGLLGDLYLTQENLDLALSAYLAAVESSDGQNASRGLRPAEILISRGAFSQAATLLERVRAAGGLEVEDQLKLRKLEARLAMGTGQADAGIRILEEIVGRNPLDGEALLLAGEYYARNGEPEKAALRFDAAAKLEGFEAEALLKDAQLKVQQQKYTEAVELLRRAQRIQPRDNVARYLEKVEQVAARVRS